MTHNHLIYIYVDFLVSLALFWTLLVSIIKVVMSNSCLLIKKNKKILFFIEKMK